MSDRKAHDRAAGAARSRLWMAVAVAVLGSMVAAGAGLWIARQSEQRMQAEFSQLTDALLQQLRTRWSQPVYGLRGARSALAVHGEVRRRDLHAYVTARNLADEFLGVRGFGMVKRVPAADLPAFLQRERQDGAPDFALRRLSGKQFPDLYVITAIYPERGNEGARGLDVGSEPARRAAFERAVATGLPTMTAPITIVQDPQQRPAVLLAVPAWRPGGEPAAPKDVPGALWGVFYAPIVVDELLADFGPRVASAMQVELLDRQPLAANKARLYRGPAPARLGSTQRVVEFDLHGRPLRLVAQASAAFEARFALWPAALVAGAGSLLAWLTAALFFQLARGRERAEARARVLTADLERLALVAQRTTNAVALCDTARRVTWVNDGFTRMTGYTAAEAQGRPLFELLVAEDGDAAEWRRLDLALGAGQAVRAELRYRGKLNHFFWADVEAQPLRDPQGQLSGLLVINSDVTERKEAERALAQERSRLANVVEATSLGIWDWDLNHGVMAVNEGWASMLGYTLDGWGCPDGRIGVERFHALCHPQDLPLVEAAMAQHARGEGAYEVELRMRHREGHDIWVLARGKALKRDAQGRAERMFGTHLDVTDAKRARLAVADSERRFRFFADNVDEGIMVSAEGVIVDVSEVWALMMRCRVSDAIGRHPTDYVAPQAREDVVQRIAAEHFEPYESLLQRADGSTFPARVRGRAVTLGDRTVRLTTVLDISALKAAQQDLAASRDLLDRTGRIAGVGGFVYDLMAEEMRWTEQTSVIHDLPPGHQPTVEEAIGFFSPEAQLALFSAISEVRSRGGQFDLELPVVTAKDRRIWVRCVAEAEPVGHRPLRLVGAIQDVTARREAQTQVRRSAELLRGAVDALDLPFALYDPEDRLVYVNEPFRLAYPDLGDLVRPGMRYETLVREMVERGHPLPQGADFEAWIKWAVARRRQEPVTELSQYADGRVMRMIDRCMPDGHVVSFRIDLTELVRAKQQAEEAAKAKGQFLANVSHEIRTPLNAVLGMMALLGQTPLDARQADYLSKADGAARTLMGILNDTLDFSKIEAGKMELDAQPFDLDELLRNLGVILAPTQAGKSLELVFDVAPDVPRALVGDAMRLQQVLVNLGGNAMKFTERGEVIVRIRRLAGEGTGGAKVHLLFEVIDTGIGISQDQMARLFQGFSQAEAGISRRYGGTGLGLVISQRLVLLMGGELKAESRLGQGSRFYFSVWLAAAQERQRGARLLTVGDRGTTPEALGHVAQRLQGLRLLLVEDNAVNQQVASELLRREGAAIQLAGSGHEALEVLRKHANDFDAVLMDLQMPGMDGLTTTRSLRRDLGLTALPVIAMTANASQADRQACLDAGMNDHVGKPFEIDGLVDLLLRVARQPGAVATADKPMPAAPLPRATQLLPEALRLAAQVAGVDIDAALARMGGQQSVYARALEGFLDQVPHHVAQWALDAPEALARRLHTLKGVTATLGLGRLATAMAAASARAADREHPSLREAFAALSAAQQPLHHLRQSLRGETAEMAPPAAATSPREALRQLVQCLEQNDAAALDVLPLLRAVLPAPQMAPLVAAVECFDYATALELVQPWITE